MDREWNWPIGLSFLSAAFVAGWNAWFWSAYRPLNPTLEGIAIASAFVAVVAVPSLMYFAVRTHKRWPAAVGIITLLACWSVGLVLAQNGRGDNSPVQFYPATIAGREVGKTKAGSPLYRFRARFNEPPNYVVTIGTSREKHETLADGTVVEIPVRSGNLDIPWRVYNEDVRYPGSER
jgi:hypothetical protein